MVEHPDGGVVLVGGKDSLDLDPILKKITEA